MTKASARTNRLRGSMDLLVLKSLSLQPLHGVGVFQRIQQITDGTIEVSYGSLFPALHRLEEHGWLVSDWQTSENNRRAKYYRLTKRGRVHLEQEVREWQRIVDAVGSALRTP